MTIGFSYCIFTKSVEGWGDSDCSSLERDLLNSSFLTSSKRGTGILIF
jgi:hypothetical protein